MAKNPLARVIGIIAGLWLIEVLLDYFGAVELTGPLADIALATLLVIIAGMTWRYLLRPILQRRGGPE